MDVADLAAIHRRAGILGGNDPLGAARAGCSCAQGRDKIAPPRHRQSRGAGKASKCENAGAARPQETIAAVCRVRSGNQQQLADDAASFQQRMRTGAFAQRNAGGDRYLQVARNDAREQCIGARLSPLRGGQHVPQIAADQGQRAIHQPRGLCDNSEHGFGIGLLARNLQRTQIRPSARGCHVNVWEMLPTRRPSSPKWVPAVA